MPPNHQSVAAGLAGLASTARTAGRAGDRWEMAIGHPWPPHRLSPTQQTET